MVLVIGTSMEQRHRQFVGRRSEVEALNGLIDAPGPSIALVHGIAGVGKSALLRHLSAGVAGRGRSVIRLDCRVIEPTERGFLRAVGDFEHVQDFARHLRDLPDPPVLVCDQFEHFRLMDTWFRRYWFQCCPRTAR